MPEKLSRFLNRAITVVLVFQLAGCGTLLYPDRRNQVPGHLDVGIVILDALGLLFFLIPGIIAFAVDFSTGCIYLPAHRTVSTTADLRIIRFDPKHTSLAQLEKIIKEQTGSTVRLSQDQVRVCRLKSSSEILDHFRQGGVDD